MIRDLTPVIEQECVYKKGQRNVHLIKNLTAKLIVDENCDIITHFISNSKLITSAWVYFDKRNSKSKKLAEICF